MNRKAEGLPNLVSLVMCVNEKSKPMLEGRLAVACGAVGVRYAKIDLGTRPTGEMFVY